MSLYDDYIKEKEDPKEEKGINEVSEKEDFLITEEKTGNKTLEEEKKEINKETLGAIREDINYKGIGPLEELNIKEQEQEKEKEEYLGSFKRIDEEIKMEEDIEEISEKKEDIKETDKEFLIDRNLPPKPSVFKKILIRILLFFILLFFFTTILFSIYWFFILEDKNQPITDIIINIFNQFK